MNVPVSASAPGGRSRLYCRFVALALAAAAAAVSAHAGPALKISANSLIADSFAKWTAETPLEKIDRYASPHANRPTLDLVLQLQALKKGGLDFTYELVVVPNYERGKLTVVEGGADLTAETIWDSEIAEHSGVLLKTQAVIRDGEFEKGIYVLPTNSALLGVTSLEALRGFVGTTVGTWAIDVQTLEAMQLKGVEKAPKAENVFLMISKARADFTLMEFSSTADMSNENGGVKLVPIPGYKLALKGSRSWIVSKKSPAAAEIHAALEKGVDAMRQEERIVRAFRESGFFHPKTIEWKRIF